MTPRVGARPVLASVHPRRRRALPQRPVSTPAYTIAPADGATAIREPILGRSAHAMPRGRAASTRRARRQTHRVHLVGDDESIASARTSRRPGLRGPVGEDGDPDAITAVDRRAAGTTRHSLAYRGFCTRQRRSHTFRRIAGRAALTSGPGVGSPSRCERHSRRPPRLAVPAIAALTPATRHAPSTTAAEPGIPPARAASYDGGHRRSAGCATPRLRQQTRSSRRGISGMVAVANREGFLWPSDGINMTWNAGTCCGISRSTTSTHSRRHRRHRRGGQRRPTPDLRPGSRTAAPSPSLACERGRLFAPPRPWLSPFPRALCRSAIRAIDSGADVHGPHRLLVEYDNGGFGSAPNTFDYWQT